MAIDFKELMKMKKEDAPKRISRDVDRAIAQVEKTSKVNQVLFDVAKANAELVKLANDKTIPLLERLKLREKLLAEHKQKRLETEQDKQLTPEQDAPKVVIEEKKPDTFALSIKLNKKQQLAAEYAAAGKSFCLTGKAGTGKTTAAREIARSLLEHGILGTHYFGYYETAAPSIAFCAFTNRATDNMRRALHKDPELEEKLANNVLTIHKLLEYTVEWITNEEGKTVPNFYPKRNASNPLDITHLIIEEASMVDIPLWKEKIFPALRPGTVVIFIGDINQLPPVFGPSVLNYALITLPVVELDQVYRQALDSPILSNALKTLEGIFPTPDNTYFKLYQSKAGSKLPSQDLVSQAFVNSIKKWYDAGEYNPDTDIILSPVNKQQTISKSGNNIKFWPCGTKNLNYHIAQFLGDKRNAKVHEIIAGRNKWYLAEGDRVMIEKQDGTIKRITLNGNYMGKQAKSIVCDINRFGQPILNHSATSLHDDDFELEGYEELNVDNITEQEKKMAASHLVDVEMDDGRTETLASAGDFSDAKFNLGYCLSVHKAQGSEWRKVFLVIHRDFTVLLFRELIYTAMTRAKEYLTIIDMSNALSKGIESQRIKGNSVKEKIEWFNAKLVLSEQVPIIP